MTLHLVGKKGYRIPPVINPSQQGALLCVDVNRPTYLPSRLGSHGDRERQGDSIVHPMSPNRFVCRIRGEGGGMRLAGGKIERVIDAAWMSAWAMTRSWTTAATIGNLLTATFVRCLFHHVPSYHQSVDSPE